MHNIMKNNGKEHIHTHIAKRDTNASTHRTEDKDSKDCNILISEKCDYIHYPRKIAAV